MRVLKRIRSLLSWAAFPLLVLSMLAGPLAGQQTATIRPGMTAEQVRSAFGPPAVVRDAGDWRYLFYTNRCLPRCGSDDVVFLRGDEVVAAVLRSPRRRFAGPAPSAALESTRSAETRSIPASAEPARVGAVRIDAPQSAESQPPPRRAPRRAAPVNLGVIRGREPAPQRPDTLRRDTLMQRDSLATPGPRLDLPPLDTVRVPRRLRTP